MIVLLDNYDSFVHNLARYLRLLGQPTRVIRSDRIDAAGVAALAPAAVVISPGPRRPEDAGCSLEVVRQLGDRVPIFGVCLGHQTIAQGCGARIVPCPPMHGSSTAIHHRGQGLFAGLPDPLEVGRYHSLAIQPESLPPCLEVTATTAEGMIMAIEHREQPLFGVQFHPESVLTAQGLRMLQNFLHAAGIPVATEALPEGLG